MLDTYSFLFRVILLYKFSYKALWGCFIDVKGNFIEVTNCWEFAEQVAV